MGRHYLVIEENTGTVKNPDITRHHLELSEPEESVESALARWVASHPDMIDRQRNREVTERRIRASVESARIAHPTSWHREQAAIQGRPFPSPPGGGTSTRRRA